MSLFVSQYEDCKTCDGYGDWEASWELNRPMVKCDSCCGTGLALTEVGRELLNLLKELGVITSLLSKKQRVL